MIKSSTRTTVTSLDDEYFNGVEEAVEFDLVDEVQFNECLLYVHQEKWQRELMNRYANNLTLLDATYKTTKYDLALFFLCVKTNTV